MIAHRIDGSGHPLVLLNGGLMTYSVWDPIVAMLSVRYRVIRFDFRGQLLSPGAAPDTMEGHSEDLFRLLDTLSVERVHLVGTSFGAEVALYAAAARPERVGSLVLLTATDRLTSEMRQHGERVMEATRRAAAGGNGAEVFRLVATKTFSGGWLERQPPDWLEMRAAQIGAFPPAYFHGLGDLMKALDSLDLSGRLERIVASTLVVAAELDMLFPLEHSRRLAESIPNATLEILEGVGHGAVIEAPERVASLVDGWIAAGHATEGSVLGNADLSEGGLENR